MDSYNMYMSHSPDAPTIYSLKDYQSIESISG